jgi:hypothetical protein
MPYSVATGSFVKLTVIKKQYAQFHSHVWNKENAAIDMWHSGQ